MRVILKVFITVSLFICLTNYSHSKINEYKIILKSYDCLDEKKKNIEISFLEEAQKLITDYKKNEEFSKKYASKVKPQKRKIEVEAEVDVDRNADVDANIKVYIQVHTDVDVELDVKKEVTKSKIRTKLKSQRRRRRKSIRKRRR